MCSHRFFSLVEIEIRFHWMDDFDENEVRFHWMDEQFAFSLLFVDDGVTVTPLCWLPSMLKRSQTKQSTFKLHRHLSSALFFSDQTLHHVGTNDLRCLFGRVRPNSGREPGRAPTVHLGQSRRCKSTVFAALYLLLVCNVHQSLTNAFLCFTSRPPTVSPVALIPST
jgi:hypothetical protein